MKIIDLLNKIANGEEVPKKIKIETHIFTKYNYPMGDGTFVSSYESNNDGEYHINDFLYPQYLNDEIEIIEEEKLVSIPESEYLKWLDFKALGNKPCEEETPIISKLYINNELQYDLEEEKKIPENNFNYIYSCEDEHIMANFENIKTTLKDITDYLKSKGE